jgi:predicted kinase
MKSKVIILRGVSGAGKDTWIKKTLKDPIVCSADDFFMRSGEYRFDPSKLGEAHGYCLHKFIIACQDPRSRARPIVINNTNTSLVEIAPYYAVAKAFGLDVEIVTFLIDADLAAHRNVHGVPLHAIEAMAKRIEDTQFPPFWDAEYSSPADWR